MLSVFWFGYGGHVLYAEALRPLIEGLGMRLVTIHEWENADIKWDRHTWLKELQKADIVICPTDISKFPAKSSNKLVQAMSLAKPVICSPLNAYVEIEKKFPGCCLFAETMDQWESQFKLLQDENLRSIISKKARNASLSYSLDVIGDKWLKIVSNNDKVDIIIPTFNNLSCLKLCLDSIRICTDILYTIIVVNNGEDNEVHEYLSRQSDIKYIKKERLNFSQAVNVGIKAGNSKYVLILNDDVIVSKGWLRILVDSCSDGVGAVGPLSNCDKGWLHNYDINVGGVDLLPGVNSFEQIVPVIPEIYEYKSPYSDRIKRNWIAFYCTLIPRTVIETVGYLDEKFVNSCEDVDFCHRIQRMGYDIIQNFKSFVFHFGAVSRKLLEKEGVKDYQESNSQTQSYLAEKYSKKTIVLYSGHSWERWDFRNVNGSGIGGSETWQVCLSREFDKLGYRVISFCDCPENGIKDGGVEYYHYSNFNKFVDENWIDYFITSRTTDPLKLPIRASKIYVFCHDIWLLSPKDQIFLDKTTKYCVLSEWHKNFFSSHHGVPLDKIIISSNGIDQKRFALKNVERNPYRLIYSSSPDRGLDTLLYLFDFIKREIPQLELHVFYGFENWEKSVNAKGDSVGLEKLKRIKLGLNKSGVFYHGRIGQWQLAIEFMKSSLLAYLTDFEETFCITAIEAQAAGLPVIASNYAGLRTTIGESGILIGSGNKGESLTKEYRERAVKEIVDILKNPDKWFYWSKRSLENAKKYSWENVARSWEGQFKLL